MAGLAMARGLCQPINPPPTWYKLPRMVSKSPLCTLQINKTNNTIIKPMGQLSTTAYIATTNPPPVPNRKMTMTHSTQHQYKLWLFSNLQKSIKMEKMHSKYLKKLTLTPWCPYPAPRNGQPPIHCPSPWSNNTSYHISPTCPDPYNNNIQYYTKQSP